MRKESAVEADSQTPVEAACLLIPEHRVPVRAAPTVFRLTTFAELDLRPELAQTVAEQGYTTPTPIQATLIPVLLSGRDAIGQAQTGTGKTAAFALPTLQRLTPGGSDVQALVLVPTRELAVQVAGAMHTYGRAMGARVLPVYGGQPYQRQIGRLRKGIDIVVGTPGRLIDLMNQGALNLGGVQTVVLDEADEMLSMGFADDLRTILSAVPERRQTVLLSATMPREIKSIAETYLRNPEVCAVASTQRTGATIEQRAYLVRDADRFAALTRLLEIEPITSALVFAHTRVATNELAERLSDLGFAAEALNGEMTQAARTETLSRFRSGRVKLLVATDVAARGLDIDNVSHVFNYDLPRDPEVFVHRVGRTGRAGKAGVAIALVPPHGRGRLRTIEAYSKQTITVHTLPGEEAVRAHRDNAALARMTEAMENPEAAHQRDLAEALVAAGYSPLDVAAAALALARADEMARPIVPIREMADVFSKQKAAKYSRADEGTDGPRVQISLATGHADGIGPQHVLGTLVNEGGLPRGAVGKIKIRERHTLVDVPARFADRLLDHGRPLRVGKQRVAIARA